MLFNLFTRNKDIHKEEIDKKYKIAVTTPPEDLQPLYTFDDGIDIILGENIKKSKYTIPLDNSDFKE
jgi:hypothetical protein